MKIFLLIIVFFVLVGCQQEERYQQPITDGGAIEMNLDFNKEVGFLQESLDIEEMFAKDIVYSLNDAGMSGSIIRVEAVGTERNPLSLSVLEVESEDGRTFRLNTSGGRVYVVEDAKTGEMLFGIIDSLDEE